jgi:hypothetical protein
MMLAPLFRRLALILAIAVTPQAALALDAPPPGATPLSAYELMTLYAGKSWQWAAGAAYFAEEGRVFTAWSTEDGAPTYATGTWKVTDSGRLCLIATWTNASGAYPTETCFNHAAVSGVIYQGSPKGEWYPFRHRTVEEEDEYAKFVDGDIVASDLAAIRRQVEQAAAGVR